MLRILPTGICCLPAWYSMLVNVLFASCMSVGCCIAVNASCVNLSQSAFLLVDGLSLVHGLSDRLVCRMIWW